MKLYQLLAQTVEARANCERSGNLEWQLRHSDRLNELVKEHMPRGSGFDCGTALDIDRSSAERLWFTTAFHHMNETGYYDGWTSHTVSVAPCLAHGFRLTIGGRDRNDIKDYIAECFGTALDTEVQS